MKTNDPALIATRVSCMLLLLAGTLVSGISPVFVKKTLFQCNCNGDVCKTNCRARRGKLITAFLIYFGGGVLLGTTLLHLLPESREAFEEHDGDDGSLEQNSSILVVFAEDGEHDHHEKFPLPEFIVCCGFFAVYFFEEIVHYFLGGHSHVPSETRAIRSFSRTNSCGTYTPRTSDAELPTTSQHRQLEVAKPAPQEEIHHHSHVPVADTLSITGLLTVAALSFHSLFEGFAIGLRPDVKSTWVVFAAISVHKFVIAFVVGLEVVAEGSKNLQVYIYMTVFAFMSPIGMAIAMITDSNVEDSSPETVSVLNAIATGTLLYVTFFEILQREEHKDLASWIQLIATCSGFVLMSLMQFASTLA